jgi:ABC-type multidrug transport system ATPase subunit
MLLERALEVSNITKRYGDILAVDHVGFEVKKEEMFGFLGLNGAGKTDFCIGIRGRDACCLHRRA